MRHPDRHLAFFRRRRRAGNNLPFLWSPAYIDPSTSGRRMDCVLCGEPVDLDDPDVLSLVARWDPGSEPAIEDAIHRTCLRRAAARERESASGN